MLIVDGIQNVISYLNQIGGEAPAVSALQHIQSDPTAASYFGQDLISLQSALSGTPYASDLSDILHGSTPPDIGSSGLDDLLQLITDMVDYIENSGNPSAQNQLMASMHSLDTQLHAIANSDPALHGGADPTLSNFAAHIDSLLSSPGGLSGLSGTMDEMASELYSMFMQMAQVVGQMGADGGGDGSGDSGGGDGTGSSVGGGAPAGGVPGGAAPGGGVPISGTPFHPQSKVGGAPGLPLAPAGPASSVPAGLGLPPGAVLPSESGSVYNSDGSVDVSYVIQDITDTIKDNWNIPGAIPQNIKDYFSSSDSDSLFSPQELAGMSPDPSVRGAEKLTEYEIAVAKNETGDFNPNHSGDNSTTWGLFSTYNPGSAPPGVLTDPGIGVLTDLQSLGKNLAGPAGGSFQNTINLTAQHDDKTVGATRILDGSNIGSGLAGYHGDFSKDFAPLILSLFGS